MVGKEPHPYRLDPVPGYWCACDRLPGATGCFVLDSAHREVSLHRDNRLWDLADLIPVGSGWELIAATDINNVGQIVGYGCKDSRFVPPGDCVDGNGTRTFRRAFLLTPVVSIADLQALVRSFDLRRRLEINLLARLAVAQILLDAGYTAIACQVLGGFGDEVEAQTGDGLTTSQAALLLQNLALVRTDTGCS